MSVYKAVYVYVYVVRFDAMYVTYLHTFVCLRVCMYLYILIHYNTHIYYILYLYYIKSFPYSRSQYFVLNYDPLSIFEVILDSPSSHTSYAKAATTTSTNNNIVYSTTEQGGSIHMLHPRLREVTESIPTPTTTHDLPHYNKDSTTSTGTAGTHKTLPTTLSATTVRCPLGQWAVQYGTIRGGTPFISYNSTHLLSLFHSSKALDIHPASTTATTLSTIKRRTYFMGVLLLQLQVYIYYIIIHACLRAFIHMYTILLFIIIIII